MLCALEMAGPLAAGGRGGSAAKFSANLPHRFARLLEYAKHRAEAEDVAAAGAQGDIQGDIRGDIDARRAAAVEEQRVRAVQVLLEQLRECRKRDLAPRDREHDGFCVAHADAAAHLERGALAIEARVY